MNASAPPPGGFMPATPAAFDPASGSLAERLLFNHRAVIILLCLLTSLVLGWQATHVGLQASFDRMLPSKHPYIQNYLEHKDELKGFSNVLRIAVEAKTSDSILNAEYMGALRELNDEVFGLPGVDRAFMKSLWTPSARWMGVTEEGLEGGQVIPDGYDGSPEAIEQLRLNISRSGEIGQVVASDFKSSIIHVPLLDIDAGGNPLDYHALSDSLEELRAKYEEQGVRLYITGFGKLVGDLLEGLQEVLLFFAAAIFICTVILYGYTRCMRSTFLVVFCSLTAVLWLLGLMAILDLQLDPYSILVPFLIFAIGMSHGAQKMNGIMQDIGRGAPRLVAARYTFRRLFLTGLTALLANVVGFAVLLVIDIQVIKDLALIASLGVGLLIFTNLVLLPILLSYTGVNPAAAERSLREERAGAQGTQRKHAVWAFLDMFTRRRAAMCAISLAVVLGVIGFATSLNLKIGDLDPGAPELRQDSRYNLDNAFITSHYEASSDVFVVMVTTPVGECSKYETLIKVDALEWHLQQLPGVESTQSLASLTRRVLAGLSEGNLKWAEIQQNQGSINAVIPRAPMELFNSSCDLLSVFVYLRDHKADTLNSVVQTVQQFADLNNGPDVQFLMAAGSAGVEAATNIVVKRSNIQMVLLVYAAVIVLSFITFRSWRAVLCAVLPLALTTVLCEALMVVLGIGVKVATLPVIALGVGIGVDYALYVLSVTLAGLRAGETLSQSYYRALKFTGKVVVLTGITLAIAVATWSFSPIKFQADMGMLLGFMFIGNMIGALVLLPALGHFLLRPSDFNAAPGVSAVPESLAAEIH